jgi:hypothetical protein
MSVVLTSENLPECLREGQILRAQTTYWELKAPDATMWRLAFRGVLERHGREADFSSFSVCSAHPLLVDYQEQWGKLYLASAAPEPKSVLRKLDEITGHWSDGWRASNRYFVPAMAETVLKTGFGLLLDAPSSLVELVRQAFLEAAIETSVIGKDLALARTPTLALLGKSYLVAEEFTIERC